MNNCEICSKVLPRNKRKYCHDPIFTECPVCLRKVRQKCDKKYIADRTCTKKCATIKGVTNSLETKTCKKCFRKFKGHKTKTYCCEERVFNCKTCGKSFEKICDKDSETLYCSSICNKKRFKKNCMKCSKSFTGFANQKYCGKVFETSCVMCGIGFPVKCVSRDTKKYCDTSCQHLHLSNSTIHLDKINEFKNIDKWAKKFKKTFGKKPSYNDFKEYFNVNNIPLYKLDKGLFTLKNNSSSELEAKVLKHIQTFYDGKILRNKRPLSKFGKKFEIDLWLPELSIGFEVQDFKTHSKVEKKVSTSFKQNFKGPVYHENKRVLAKKQLNVDLYDIWEDEILSGTFKEKVDKIIGKAI